MAKTPQTLHADIERRFPDNEEAKITPQVTRNMLHDLVDATARGPNDTIGGTKLVIYLKHDEAVQAGRAAYDSLDQVKNTSIVLGNLARVDLFPGAPGTWLLAIWDDGEGPYPLAKYGIEKFRGLADGTGAFTWSINPADGLLPLKWVLRDSAEALAANIDLWRADYNKDGKPPGYKVNDLVRWAFTTPTGRKIPTFSANKAGPLPAPSRVEGDENWSVFNPTPAEFSPVQAVTPEELRGLKAAGKLKSNRLYIVTPRLIPNDPEDGAYGDVFVRALMESELEPTGWLLVSATDKQLVNYDVATDTTTPAGSTKQPFLLATSSGLTGYDTAQAAADAAPAGATLYCYADVPKGLETKVSMQLEAPGRYIRQLVVAENTVLTARFREVSGVQLGGGATADFHGTLRVTTTGDSALFGYNVKVKWTGDVYYTSTNAAGGAFYLAGPESVFEYLGGTIYVLKKGAGILAGSGAEVRVHGPIISHDVCLVQGNGALDCYAPLDNRTSTTGRSALLVSQNAAFYKNMTLHAGCEVLGPDGVAIITNNNPGQTALVEVLGTFASTGPVPDAVQFVYLTPAPAGGGGTAPAYSLPAATATRRGGVSIGAGLSVDGDRLSTSVATPGGTVLTLTQDAEYAPIYSGTFTLDTANAKTGVVIFAYLGPGANAPTLPAGCQLLSGTYQAGKSLMYAFKVGANAAIQYTISIL